MTFEPHDIDKLAVASLSEDERTRAVVYVDERTLEPGERLEVDGREIEITAPTVVAFADLEPGANWGHRSRYILVDRDSGDMRQIDAQLPPFLRHTPDSLKVAYRAPGVPDWAVATAR